MAAYLYASVCMLSFIQQELVRPVFLNGAFSYRPAIASGLMVKNAFL